MTNLNIGSRLICASSTVNKESDNIGRLLRTSFKPANQTPPCFVLRWSPPETKASETKREYHLTVPRKMHPNMGAVGDEGRLREPGL